ncbi:MAG TPA: ferrous iron transporter B [Pirellulales bacterium]|jgi:ferrous iron transport protein B|nr:ferrous iron transporter B [Pirellulales bacterium]
MLATASKTVTVALLGNPNTGKSTLFNALAGVHQRVGNYPGVTVEKKVGQLEFAGQRFSLIDLPGTYSLAPRSLDEMVAVDVLLGRRQETRSPDAVLCILDASNLERNLYLVSQVLELGLPTVLALNMTDIAQTRGLKLDLPRLRKQLGIPVLPVQANKRIGLEALKQALADAAGKKTSPPASPFPAEFCHEVQALSDSIAAARNGHPPIPRYLIERLLLDTGGYLEHHTFAGLGAEMPGWLAAARARLAAAGYPVPAVEAMSRYEWVGRVLAGVITRPAQRPKTFGDKLDRVLTHKIWGTLIFALVMFVMFQAVFTWAKPFMDGIDTATNKLADWVDRDALLAPGALRSLLVSGVIGGVGSVVTFLPQIFFLFFFIAVLEDCGYMARAAYLMDRIMVKVGLSGKSFIPLLSSFACAVPGIMSTRVIENRRDRLTTMLVAPLMTCSARLPVYTLLILAFVPSKTLFEIGGWNVHLFGLDLYLGWSFTTQGLTMFGLYVLGIVTAMLVAFVLKRTFFRGETPPFVMELPNYKRPGTALVLHRMFEQAWSFIRNAGTIILAVAILVWAAAYYPHNTAAVEGPHQAALAEIDAKLAQLPETVEPSSERKDLEDQKANIQNEIAGQYQQQSYLGQAGKFIEPAVKPLGWDWRIGCAVVASFPAREVVIATLGVIYDMGKDVKEENESLHKTLQDAKWDGTDRPVYNLPVALSIMVFFALCAQCASTLAIIKRETNTWRWPIFTFAYMTVLAYVGAFATYHIGMFFA